jgi:hypothetical protein
MTEAQWLACTDPLPMLLALRGGVVSGRKLRLFAAACCRRIWPLMTDGRSRQAVEVAEAVADSLVGDAERSQARRAAQQASGSRASSSPPVAQRWGRRAASAAYWAAARDAEEAASQAPVLAIESMIWQGGGYGGWDWRPIKRQEEESQADLLRDIFGPRPFSPQLPLPPRVLAWGEGIVARLAEAAYTDRLPEGTLDPLRLAVLADALEDAGCDAAELLAHLRGAGPHVRGCWALDALLLKA